ncbi:glycolate oxidase iron-sulfur subunit [Paucibacter oligotrophus]|uniref:Glycolate oxidase iron-sulfur subunit n=1 Tax=Roseateles oligotrophus TaxID=1769250 RepID=A0A840L5E4_9BURK|nr:glycolate oxidase subunit GlcF [Roseateles oligotrophus]MBB4843236.1 glycolate oxidase iron-sulfur subunit [Roseateles oligotrophus]
MQTQLSEEFQANPEGKAAAAILSRCVHCGFCTATCPTYQLLGDELDGPRGRIYLIKQVLEGAEPTRSTQQHLDRCLTCRNCESTCPSGVQYGQLLEIGRGIVEAKVERPRREQVARWLLKEGLTSPAFGPAMALGRRLRPLLPAALQDKVPGPAPRSAHDWPSGQHPRKMGLLLGCVQPGMAPNINSATARVLDAAGIQTLVADAAGCCGAIRSHLNDHEGGLDDMRRNIDAWWPLVEGLTEHGKIEALVMNASGCGLTVKDYGRALAHDPAYAEKAARVSAITRDLSELLPQLLPALQARLADKPAAPLPKLAYHPPCTLQHGQQLRGGVESGLQALGFDIRQAPCDAHLCCGSAGTYSVLQPALSKQLREQKLQALAPLRADLIVSANIGCIQHLQSGSPDTPVRHWVEVLDDQLK